jgi:hypothetical protein
MNTFNQSTDKKKLLIPAIILIGACSRLIPHPMNFTPIAALALFGGSYIKDKRMAFLIPMAAMLFSDLLLQISNGTGFHDQMIWVYASMALVTMVGFWLRERQQGQNIVIASLVGSILFFALTNFGVWALGYYGYTASGLAQTYIMAIPFFKGTFLGDLFYNAIFFGSYAMITRYVPAFATKKAK